MKTTLTKIRKLLRPFWSVFAFGVITSAAQAASTAVHRLDHSVSVQLEAPDGDIETLVHTLDEGYYVGGRFTKIGGVPRAGVAKVKADGSIDSGFKPDGALYGTIFAVTPQKDGKVVVGGNFTVFHSATLNGIARVNADGSLDTSFNAGSGFDGTVETIVQQTDGRLLVGGEFTHFNGKTCKGIVRLNTNGSLDTSFAPSSIEGFVEAIALQTDGKVFVGSSVKPDYGPTTGSLVRLNANGSLDSTFSIRPKAKYLSSVYAIVVQPDGRVLVGGSFSFANRDSGPGTNMIRLNTDGTVDSSFNIGDAFDRIVLSISLQKDGMIVVGGDFTTFNKVKTNQVARLKTNGALDTAFSSKGGFTGQDTYGKSLKSVIAKSDGHLIIAGAFDKYNGISVKKIAHITPTGTLDATHDNFAFKRPGKAFYTVSTPNGLVLGGDFDSVNGTARNRIARIKANGSFDTAFNPGSGFDNNVRVIAAQADGRLIVGGLFERFNGATRKKIARLNTDGTLDTSFDPGTGVDGEISSLAIQKDGKIIIGGNFETFNGTSREGIARLNINGTLDTSFKAAPGAHQWVSALALLPDGRILVGAPGSGFDGVTSPGMARLKTDGTVDTTFISTLSDNAEVSGFAVQKDGRVLVSGLIFKYRDPSTGFVYRLNDNGTIDSSYGAGETFDSDVKAIALQPDGRLIVSGQFTHFNKTACAPIVRLNTNGKIDTSFTVKDVIGINDVTQINVTPAGQLVLASTSYSYFDAVSAVSNGVLQVGLAVLTAE